MTVEPLAHTPLHALHKSLGAKLVAFAGYEMPVQYPSGIVAEHLHTRAKASLFDVSHMGQVILSGPQVIAALERLVPADIAGLGECRVRYTVFTNEAGGIRDDLMVAKDGESLRLVVNAACKAADLDHLRHHLGPSTLRHLDEHALLALQGPEAANVLARLASGTVSMGFMSAAEIDFAGTRCHVTRSGYTGEDGFEISIANEAAEDLARRLLTNPSVKPIGLGARDSLRLEAGLCLYGHDIDTTTTPIEADLAWTISARRRAEGGFPGAQVIARQLAEGTARKRVGLAPQEKAPARENTKILSPDGAEIGIVTSGGFGPSLGAPVAMGYVVADEAEPGARVSLLVREQKRPALVARLPFVPHHYHRR
jgi:aminomethyltransferase